MSRKQPLDQWTDQVITAFPKLTRPQAVVLALYSFGVILAHRCGLNSVAAVLVPLLGLQFSTVRSRLQEFYQPAHAKSDRDHRRQLEVTTCFAPLLAWIRSVVELAHSEQKGAYWSRIGYREMSVS